MISVDFYKLIPIALIFDFSILRILQVMHSNRIMKKYIAKLNLLDFDDVTDNNFVKSVITEAKKYQSFKIGNKSSEKEIYVLRFLLSIR